jgi:branched-chain amino acid transport system permease protein
MDWEAIIRNFLAAGVGDFAMIYTIAAVGMNLHYGYTGLLNFGQVGFMLAGAYGLSIIVSTFNLGFVTGLLVGVAAAVVLALLLGAPTLRLRADYLAIVTIVSAEIIRLTGRSTSLREYTNGSFGLTQFADDFYALNPLPQGRYGIGFVNFNERIFWALVVGWGLAAVCTLVVYVLIHSPWGRVLKSIREDEDAARSLGKNVFAYKMQSLVLGGVFGALAGLMQAINTYSPPVTFFIFTALVLGGAATTWGPIVGAMIFWALLSFTDNVLRQMIEAGYMPTWIMDGVQVGQVRFMLVGLGLMLLMIFRPQGIFGDKRELSFDV